MTTPLAVQDPLVSGALCTKLSNLRRPSSCRPRLRRKAGVINRGKAAIAARPRHTGWVLKELLGHHHKTLSMDMTERQAASTVNANRPLQAAAKDMHGCQHPAGLKQGVHLGRGARGGEAGGWRRWSGWGWGGVLLQGCLPLPPDQPAAGPPEPARLPHAEHALRHHRGRAVLPAGGGPFCLCEALPRGADQWPRAASGWLIHGAPSAQASRLRLPVPGVGRLALRVSMHQ